MNLLTSTTSVILKDFSGENQPEVLRPLMGTSYSHIPAFEQILQQLNQWNILTAVEQLDHLILNYPDYRILAIRLKAEIYGTYDYYQAAWEQFDLILAEDATDLQAIFLTTIYAHLLNQSTYYHERYLQLSKLYPKHAKILTQLIRFIDQFKASQNLGARLKSRVDLDAIVVFGMGLTSEGTLPDKLEMRLQKALSLAIEYPKAKIILSGGAVANVYNEAREMAKWFIAREIVYSRLIVEPLAKDTVGNSLESAKIILNANFKTICAVTSATHLPRAWMSLQANRQLLLNGVKVYAAAPSEELNDTIPDNEQNMSYTTVLRCAALFTMDDFLV